MIDSPWLVAFLACVYMLGAWGTYLVTTSNTGNDKLSAAERLEIEHHMGSLDTVLYMICIILSAVWPVLWVLVIGQTIGQRIGKHLRSR